MKLIVTEKQSVAESIATVLKVPFKGKQNGFVENSEYIITWCQGHLVTLADAQAYDPKYDKWNLADLPIIPDKWKYVTLKQTSKQYKIVTDLMKGDKTSEIICATDAGREGELIFRLVYNKCNCKKPIKRLWISSMEEKAIAEGFLKLRDGKDFDAVYKAAECRQWADWLVGINASRNFALITDLKNVSVGRVQTPTLNFIVEREKEIENFIKKPFYKVSLSNSSDNFKAVTEQIDDKGKAESIKTACENSKAVVQSVTQEEKRTSPPKLFDLTSLQRTANKQLGFTAAQTLEYVQTLYEKKLLTYPRTDSSYLTTDMTDKIPTLLKSAETILGLTPKKDYIISRVINDKKVTDHHAVIITETAGQSDLGSLSPAQKRIMTLVAERMLCATQPDYIYTETVMKIECANIVFTCKGKSVVDKGWKDILKKNEQDKYLPNYTEGMSISNFETSLEEHFTSPPKYFTEDTLLGAMENASSDPNAERKGIGTPATRDGIIETLVKKELIERKTEVKTVYLRPTFKGVKLIEILPLYIKSPELTAEWEHELDLITRGKSESKDFMKQIEELTKKLIHDYKDKRFDILPKTSLGKCPRCKSEVFANGKAYKCSNSNCKFSLWENNKFFTNAKKKLTSEIVGKLLIDGKVKMKNLYSPKTDKHYDATIILEDTGEYTNFKLDFERK